jgi:hypothetical protein
MPRRSSGPLRRRGGPWYGRFADRLDFEREARSMFGVKSKFGAGGGGYVVHLTVDVPGYQPRRLRIAFDRRHVDVPRVFVDGPTSSKHRYSDMSLCMWYPPDPEELRWVRPDGLVALIGYAIVHLFREAWWRETGEWLGPEAPHVLDSPKAGGRENDDHRR